MRRCPSTWVAGVRAAIALLLLAAAPALATAAEPERGLVYHAAPKPLPVDAVVEDWPHFLGPHHNATTRETRLLDTWPKDGPARVWEYETGEGYACPVIAEGRLVYFHRVGNRETLDCLDPETGRRHWRFDYAVEYEDRYGYSPGPRSSAVIAGGRVYAAGVTAMLHCLDLATGQLIWKRDLAAEYRIPQYFFGYGPTPFVWRDRLIVTIGGKAPDGTAGTGVAAFDSLTGRTLWETSDVWGASYASPIVAQLQGRDVVLAMMGGESRPAQGGLLTLDPQDGKVLDRFPWRARAYESATAQTPLVLDDRRVFISECYDKGGTLLEYDASLKAKPLWAQRGFGLHWMMPLARDGHLYGYAGRNPPDTEFKCVDLATGAIVWHDDTRFDQDGRVNSFFRGTLLRAGERVFSLGEDGLWAELELSRRGLVTRQRVRLFLANSAWTLPAMHRGLLYVAQNSRDVRGEKGPRIICYDFRGR
jgi:outer membrane protein assembly factor BamB